MSTATIDDRKAGSEAGLDADGRAKVLESFADVCDACDDLERAAGVLGQVPGLGIEAGLVLDAMRSSIAARELIAKVRDGFPDDEPGD
jgi:hypothetical protein